MRNVLFFLLFSTGIASGNQSFFTQRNPAVKYGAGGGFKFKANCTNIEYDFQIDLYIDKVKKILEALVSNASIFLINTTIKGGAYFQASTTCTGKIMEYVAEYPEQSAKLTQCMNENIETRGSLGGQSGMWFPVPVPVPWVNNVTDSSVSPGTELKISGCINRVLSGEMGEHFRRCIDNEQQKNLRYIRKLLKLSLKTSFDMRMKNTQHCLLTEKHSEKDISAGVRVEIFPDGTKIKKELSGTKVEKYAYSFFAPDEEDMKLIYSAVDDYFEYQVLGDTRLINQESLPLKWYEWFRRGSWRESEYTCIDTIEAIGEEYNRADQLKLAVCSHYLETLQEVMVEKALSTTIPANSEIEAELLKETYKSIKVNLKKEIEKFRNLLRKINSIKAQSPKS